MRINRSELVWNLGFIVALLPVILLRDVTPFNELRYLSIADEALRNHTFWAFHNHGEAYADKPPLFLWGVMLIRAITGRHLTWLAVLLFSLLPALGVANVMNRWTQRSGHGSVSPAMLLTTGLFTGAAIIIRMDMLMCLFIVLAIRSFWRITSTTSDDGVRREKWLFPLWLFLAVFTKGPLGLLIPLCTSTVWLATERRLSEFPRCWGWRTWCPLLAACAIWFAAVYAEGGRAYLDNLLFHQTVGRAVNSFHHDEPFYYYAVCFFYCLAPWSLLVGGITVASLRNRKSIAALPRFFLTTGLTTIVLLSCLSSKIQIYMLPAVPFLVCGTAILLPRFRGKRWPDITIALPGALFVTALPAIPIALRLGAPEYLDSIFIYIAAGILSATGIMSLWRLFRKNGPGNRERAIGIIAGGMMSAIFAGGWAMPFINPYIGYGAVCGKATELSRMKGISDIRTWKMSRAANMDFYLHRPIEIAPDGMVPQADSDRPFILLTRINELDNFPGAEIYIMGRYAAIIVRPASATDPKDKSTIIQSTQGQ